MVQDNRVPLAVSKRIRAPKPLAPVVPASKHPPCLQSQPGCTSCHPKPPATRVQTLLLSPPLALREVLSRVRLDDLLRCVRLDSQGLLWQFLKRAIECWHRLQGDRWHTLSPGMTWTASGRDLASRSDLSIGKRLRFIRHPRFMGHLLLQIIRHKQFGRRLRSIRLPPFTRILRCNKCPWCNSFPWLILTHRL